MKKVFFSIICIATIVSASGQVDYKAVFTKTEKDVIPEGITINPVDKKIYVSSVALMKIIAIDPTGAHQDFLTTRQSGFLEGLGMKIDEKKQWLWVVSNQKQDKGYTSQLQAFDIKTKKVKHRCAITDTVDHLFNDLILHPNGKVYITDTYGSALYEFDPARKELNLLIHDSLLNGANGIAYDAKGKIFVATREGLLQLDPLSKKIIPLTFNDSRKALWMDGIVYWNNSIIGVADIGIVQYSLNAEDNQITGEKILDQGNKLFHEPTTAALLSNKLYVVANSYLAAYNENHESVKGIQDKLGSVVILVYSLDKL